MNNTLHLLLTLTASCLMCLSLPAAGLTSAPGDTLLLTVVNHSDHILSYKNVTHANAGNAFMLSSKDILPGASITIQATSTHWSGIAGDLTFEDTHGHKNILKIQDPLQIAINRHPGQFTMDNTRLVSFNSLRKFNADTDPHRLAWTEVTVDIQNRMHA